MFYNTRETNAASDQGHMPSSRGIKWPERLELNYESTERKKTPEHIHTYAFPSLSLTSFDTNYARATFFRGNSGRK